MLQVEVNNIGTAKWIEPSAISQYGVVKLGTVNPYDRISQLQTDTWLSGNRVADTGLAVSPGDRLTLSFMIKAPTTPGVYREYFRLVSEYVAWFGPAIGWKITVQ